MRSRLPRQLFIITAVMICCLLAMSAFGGVMANDHGVQDVDLHPPDPAIESDGQTIEIEVTNPDSDPLIFPLIEVPLQNGLEIPAERRSVVSGTEFVDGVTVLVDGQEEDRTAFIDGSTFRGSDALFIEGEEIEAGETRSYAFDVTITTSNEITVETDVRPLNAEENNVRESESIDPVALGTIEATTDGDAPIEISGPLLDEDQTGSDTIEIDVPGDSEYDVGTELSLLDSTVTIEDLSVSQFTTETVTFTDGETGDALSPFVIAQTGDAAVVENSDSRTISRGNAETTTTQTVEFDAESNGGTTIIALEDEQTLPMQDVSGTSAIIDRSEWIDTPGETSVARVEIDGAFDETVSITFEGYNVGDVTLTNEVTSDDAQAIAASVAADQEQLQYGDVNDDGEVTAVDAMKTQQYVEGNRDAEYDLNGGN